MGKKNSPLIRSGRIIWYIFIIMGPAVPILFPQWANRYPLLKYIFTPAWMALVGKLLYDNSNRFYFWFTRSWMWVTNAGVDWSLSVDLTGKSDKKNLEIIFDKIIKIYPDAKPWHNEEFKKIIELPFGCNIRFGQSVFQDGIERTYTTFYLNVSELVVPFRESGEMLNKLVSLIADVILPIVKPEKEKYSFKVKFGDTNPYFGLFVRRLRIPDQSLVTFRVEFDETVGHKKEKVDVSESRVALTTQSLPNLQILSRRYITLATLDMSNS